MFLGWYDPDKKWPARAKLADAVARYIEKFGIQPEVCLTNVTDAAELATDQEAPDLLVRGVSYIPRFTFYVGVDDSAEEALPAAA